jgi:Uma2 family endonuclease
MTAQDGACVVCVEHAGDRDARSGGTAEVRLGDGGSEIMSVALVDHTGPWTADDVEALPDAGDHARFEVYEGGVLVVSPAPGWAISGRPTGCTVLWPSGPHCGRRCRGARAVNVALPGGKLLVPDVVVVAAGAVGETTTRIPCEAVLAVVEIVSPSTVSIDRPVRPVMCAEPGIPVYWRVELQGTAKIGLPRVPSRL